MERPTSSLSPNGSSTIASSLLSGVHGRKRRRERNIEKVDLQRARRYGMVEPARHGRLKYTWAGVTFIYDPARNKEITSYESSDASSCNAGTRKVPPVILSKRVEYTSAEKVLEHHQIKEHLLEHREEWTSHSVLIVDMSGSMRQDDVNGARCRSDGVWMTLARDFVQSQLQGDLAKSTDLVSVVVMRGTADVILHCEPLGWVLYNKFVEFREWTAMRPGGPGNYLPALQEATRLLEENPLGTCALSLLFFSDGRPSDKGDFESITGKIAARFGRRLTISCVGMADPSEDFSTLRNMVNEASAYGAIAAFERPSLNTHALSATISCLVTSLAQTKASMTCLRTGRLRSVRTDILREKRHTADDLVLTDEWQIYHNHTYTHYVQRMWTWDPARDDFVYLHDDRCIFCYKHVRCNSTGVIKTVNGTLCPNCKACYICSACAALGVKEHIGTENCRAFLDDRRNKIMVHKFVPSFSVAVKRSAFGEGAERIVHKFRFLDDTMQFTGAKWVSKESRFVEDHETYETKMDYHREFMRTQVLASEFADRFNEALDRLEESVHPYYHVWLRSLPRIRFLEPFVVELIEAGKERIILVEEMLEGHYQKFNNNMGYVVNRPNVCDAALRCSKAALRFVDLSNDNGFAEGIGRTKNSVDEGRRSSHKANEPEMFIRKPSGPQGGCRYTDVRMEDFPQAFSHFTYAVSNKRLMVVDIQGVLQRHMDGRHEFILTDPAIHKRNSRNTQLRLGGLGRTDRGDKGMKAFWETHVCTDACTLLGLVQEL